MRKPFRIVAYGELSARTEVANEFAAMLSAIRSGILASRLMKDEKESLFPKLATIGFDSIAKAS
jgi:hypothetical protein